MITGQLNLEISEKSWLFFAAKILTSNQLIREISGLSEFLSKFNRLKSINFKLDANDY